LEIPEQELQTIFRIMLLVSSMSEYWRRSFSRFLSPSHQGRLFNRTQILYSPGNPVIGVVLRTPIGETYYIIYCFRADSIGEFRVER